MLKRFIRGRLGVVNDVPPRRRHPARAPRESSSAPLVALTFDDGPSAWTPRILDVFSEHGGRATFFVLGRSISGYEPVLRRIVDEGHEIGNHLFSHRDAATLTSREIRREIGATAQLVRDTVGFEPKLVRPPYGSAPERLALAARRLAIRATVQRSVDPADWRERDPDVIVQTVLANIKDGSIVCLHDGSPDPRRSQPRDATVDAVAELVPALRSRGFELVTVSGMLDARA